ncbi:hypothetical protein [Rubrivirga sp.]|uniref:hypothetical protein n=1 Tax=Rubrivirga sp. TaxID=1885344 RepID=UPI003B521076
MSSTPTTTSKRPPKRRASAKARASVALPGWADLPASPPSKLAGTATRAKAGAKKAGTQAAKKVRRARPLDAVPSLRFGLTTLLVCVVITLFLGHAYATRATLDALQEARRENERLRLTHQRLQGDVDRMTGPSAVLGRAAGLGLEEGVAYGPTIRLGEE